MRIADLNLTVAGKTLNVVAVNPQDLQEPAQYILTDDSLPRAAQPTIQALVRPVAKNKMRLRREIEVIFPNIKTDPNGVVSLSTPDRFVLAISPDELTSESVIADRLATLLAFVESPQGKAVLSGQRLI